MAATYDLLPQNSLTPDIPPDFPWPDGFSFVSHLNVTDKVLFFKETSFAGLIGRSDVEDLVIILGTHNPLEWIEDFEGNPESYTTADGCACQVEHGFHQFYQEITVRMPTPIALTAWMAIQSRGTRPAIIIGHSLGAACGGIVSADAYAPRYVLFAMPKWGDIVGSKHLRDKGRAGSGVPRNVQDVVPMAPPLAIFQSVLPESWFNSDMMGIPGGDSARHSMQDCYLAACAAS